MDVAVIGGGIVGTSAAAFLAGAGARVTIYEREAIAAGASGRNSGIVQHPFDAALVPLYQETVDIYRSLDDEATPTGFRLDAEPAGLLLVTPSIDVARRLAVRLGRVHPHLDLVVLDADEVRRLEPAMAPGIAECRVAVGYPVVPSAPTYAMATLAERRGAVIRQGRAATPIVEDGRCRGVNVDGRDIPADAVIVAAGPWTPEVVDPTGRWRPIRPVWGVVVETLFTSPPRHLIEEAEMDEALGIDAGDALEPIGATAASADPHVPAGFSLVTAGGVSVVGSTFLEREPDPTAWTERLVAHGARFIPSLADAPIRDVRACARPTALDGRPLIGQIPGVEGLYVCAGHGPWGISTGPASARLVVDLVLGRSVAVPPELSAARFGSPVGV